MAEGNAEMLGDFLTPEQARQRLANMGYEDLKLIPKGNHYLQALSFISRSRKPESLYRIIDSTRALDPKHHKSWQDEKVPVIKIITGKNLEAWSKTKREIFQKKHKTI